MQLNELLSSSVSQWKTLFTMVSVRQDSYILSDHVVTLLIGNSSQPTAGLHHVTISFAALTYNRRICLLKFFQCCFCMNSPLILVGTERAFEAPLPPVLAKMLNNFKTVQAMSTKLCTIS